MAFDTKNVNLGLRHLRSADPVLREVIRRAGPFRCRVVRNRFQALVHSIIGQQISGKAASSIRARLKDYLAPRQISAASLCGLSRDELRKVGISPQKATYLLDLATRVSSGELRLDRIARLPDEGVIAALTEVKGIGVWTAQMFLIFSLGRLDIFPHQDLGVRVAIRNLYGLDDLPDKEESHRIAAAWRPYASIASWYCWRSLEFKKQL
jgi:DNA-3-methyladenine glycosylase II